LLRNWIPWFPSSTSLGVQAIYFPWADESPPFLLLVYPPLKLWEHLTLCLLQFFNSLTLLIFNFPCSLPWHSVWFCMGKLKTWDWEPDLYSFSNKEPVYGLTSRSLFKNLSKLKDTPRRVLYLLFIRASPNFKRAKACLDVLYFSIKDAYLMEKHSANLIVYKISMRNG